MSEIPTACREYDEHLSALLDEELSQDRVTAVREHISGCVRCTRRFEALGRVDALLARTPMPEVAGSLSRRLATRIAESERAAGGLERSRSAPPRRRNRWRNRPAWAAAMAAAAALALYLASPGRRSPVPLAGPEPEQIAERPVPESIADPDSSRDPAAAGERLAREAAPAPIEETVSEIRLAREPARVPAPTPREPVEKIAAVPPAPGRPPEVEAVAALDLDAISDEELDLIFELDILENLDAIANLELLEWLLLLEEEAG